MIRGPEALHSLEEALRDIRREEDEVAKRLARSGERVTKFRETEADLFRQLARVRLEPTTQAELEGRISAAESHARELLKRHAAQLAGHESALAEHDAAISALTAERAAALAEAESRQAALDRLAAETAGRMEDDSAYKKLRAAAEDLHRIAEKSVEKTELAEADREEKGRPYRDDPLFSYLWERGYGTRDYRANLVVRFFDGKVAALVRYHQARPNFAMLNEIPMRLREHAERQQANAAAAEAELEAMEVAAVDAAGGKPLRDALAEARRRIEDIDARILAAEDARDAAADALRALAEGSDPAFEEALASLAAGLGREDLETLLAEARRTRTARDDTIIAQIDDTRARAREEEGEAKDNRERLKTLASRRRELEDIEWEFKKSRFDDPRSTFKEDRLVGDLLNDFLRGSITAATYWAAWQKSQNWSGGDWGGLGSSGTSRTRKDDPWGGAFDWPDASFGGSGKRRSSGGFGGAWGLPGSTGRSSGGGFSRPRTGSSGSRKSGGFKTGGRF